MAAYIPTLDNIIRECMRLRMQLLKPTDTPFAVLLSAHYAADKIQADVEDLADDILSDANKALDEVNSSPNLNSPKPVTNQPANVYIAGDCHEVSYSEPSFD